MNVIEPFWERLISIELWLRVIVKLMEIALILVLARLALLLGRKILARILRPVEGRMITSEAAERRARTLLMMLQSLLKYVIVVAAFLIILGRLGVSTGSLLTGGAIAGLAVTFGAQNLIRDFFTGIALLIEDAFTIGDRVTIAGVTGEVVEMGMRMVKLRDEDGTMHLVPYGVIQTVSNRSRALATQAPRDRAPIETAPAASDESPFEEIAGR
ncbi:MAG: mechanosensitive ion channel family protein [Blastocatellia bacterium]|nr:mechanosensitive ion channel family protein [Blastocatellia bacterium]MCS7158387.1 mechanosensitive ion channel family protein [Blastocatellia bacterium]MCX7752893.1 mechanosensitive ion channel family protein [Blastocatellia bacterium]MDW8167949.1 mechanosensitive ion channel [Acidobacteriota bacterium]MDW8255974.1 mechanosensitive ion channel [Acidobacteriota bacterium]